MINCTGMVIAIYKNGEFQTLEPFGVASSLIEMKSDPYEVDGISFKDLKIIGIRNLPEKSNDLLIVDKEVAIFGWSIGRDDLIYLDGHMVKDKDGKVLASQTLVRLAK